MPPECRSEHLNAMSSTNLGMKYSSRAKFSQISQSQRSWPTRQWFKLLHYVKFSLPKSLNPAKSHQVYKYDLVPRHSNDHTPLRTSLASVDHQIHAHADIYTRRRKQSVAHKLGRQFFGIGVRWFRKSSQDDAKDGFSLDGHWILNFCKELLQIELCACQGFGCVSAADTMNTSKRWKVTWSASWRCSLVWFE